MIRRAIAAALVGIGSRLDLESTTGNGILPRDVAGAILAGHAIASIPIETGEDKAYAEGPAPR